MTTLFVSDLHLSKQCPAVMDLFLSFLTQDSSRAEALYILGDLFEYWIGDEVASTREFAPVITTLRMLTSSGVSCFVMHGNRDLLLGAGFENATGCQILPDPTVIDLYGTSTLLSHGDYLCTDDSEYQAFRKKVRDPEWQQRFLAKDLDERETIIRTYRDISTATTATKSPEIMDVNQQTVGMEMKKYGVLHMIHGHTHRPNEHRFPLNGQTAKRFVLGDWHEQGSVLRCDAEGWALEGFPLLSTKLEATP